MQFLLHPASNASVTDMLVIQQTYDYYQTNIDSDVNAPVVYVTTLDEEEMLKIFNAERDEHYNELLAFYKQDDNLDVIVLNERSRDGSDIRMLSMSHEYLHHLMFTGKMGDNPFYVFHEGMAIFHSNLLLGYFDPNYNRDGLCTWLDGGNDYTGILPVLLNTYEFNEDMYPLARWYGQELHFLRLNSLISRNQDLYNVMDDPFKATVVNILLTLNNIENTNDCVGG